MVGGSRSGKGCGCEGRRPVGDRTSKLKPVRVKELGLTGVRAAIVAKKLGNADGCEGTAGKQRP